MPGPMMPQRPMQGVARGLAQQGQNPWQQQMPQGQPGAPGQPWGAQATGQLQGLSQKLGNQAWGDPGQGAPTITNPSANRPAQGVPQQADAFRQAAQQYAMQQRPEAEDPRMRGMAR